MEFQIPNEIRLLAIDVFGDDNFEIYDFDYNRVYIIRNNEEYNIRTWDITESFIRWTLYKVIMNPDGSIQGDEEKEGPYMYRIKKPKKTSSNKLTGKKNNHSLLSYEDFPFRYFSPLDVTKIKL